MEVSLCGSVNELLITYSMNITTKFFFNVFVYALMKKRITFCHI